MTTISTMLPVTLPRFAPPVPPQDTAPQTSSQAAVWAATNGDNQNGEPLDFDILAEYLLDDSAAVGSNTTTGIPQFDYSETTTGSGVVSPEQSEDGLSLMIEAALPVAPPTTVTAPSVLLTNRANAHVQMPQRQPILAPSTETAPPQTGMPMAPAAPAVSTFPAQPAAIPPVAPFQGTSMIVNHHAPPSLTVTIPGNKRRRVDGATQVVAGSQILSNGHFAANNTMTGRGRQKSQAQIDRRRERNRILARRTRLRKKFFFESLQKDVIDLQRENAILKELASKKLPLETSKKLLAECKATEKLPSAVQEAVGESVADMNSQDFNLVHSIQRSQQCFVITDPSLQDNPIVYASDDFLTLTGYQRGEVLGRNCRFLQGTETSPRKVERIRKAVSLGEDTTVTMINYTADGTAFWNKLFIAALRDAQNNIVNYIGVIVKVASPDPDDQETGKRLPGEQSTPMNGEEENVPLDTKTSADNGKTNTIQTSEDPVTDPLNITAPPASSVLS
mmetsp:Transcript_33593/g.38266  ORF Transcript_33593/g.38266 Transcript_33593/m.38266 type:complete len:505 (+) Transcript_33593:38-1552(+)|eukprot:CAMPEP_0194162634 /NCGR_PEP_ID=MMETSP0152-20130528/79599_1 /TAXON_ID=1049557 /ORGANISM="Thalassiothrix antarctica, Strain L6-D1" /LENGTH=504 /DNA_ID=CAMNT_0038872543 /DNA_START=770 /DNA_END=2284 /DNA_ORIENTATION=-